ncbi:septal ring lytic transglycosylase RlpA family protein [Lewinella sp. IMCC34183]|uniref:septal ring lytic transglycosylase RlpA family protein n=1 Tax=Lewinella sp. IMCC34183 TaxID=2248762 RepID=UPI000E223694|nr:septal ring lytic transglycosylase RlpA family protein [Lewinella sp. IMCC34183]
MHYIDTRFRPLLVAGLFLFFAAGLSAQSSEGLASYYADRFHDKPTSTGETYNKNALTAASKEYPYNTLLQVTNVASGKTVRVRVNDCGPHHPDRIIDLSGAAGRKIGLLRTGTAKVKLRVIEIGDDGPTCNRGAWSRAERKRKADAKNGPVPPTVTTVAVTPPPAAQPAAPAPPATVAPAPAAPALTAKGVAPGRRIFADDALLYGVQVGAFGKENNAATLVQALKDKGFPDAWSEPAGKVFRVYTGHYYFQDEARNLRDRVRRAGYADAAVRRVQ